MPHNLATDFGLTELEQQIYGANGYSFGWLPEPPDPNDPSYGAGPFGADVPPVIPPTVDLRSGFPDPPFDQGPVLSCTANAIAAAVQYARGKQNLPAFVPSRMFIWWNERVVEGSQQLNSGAYIRDGVRSTDLQGYCKETTLSYDVTTFRDAPPAAAFDEGKRYKSIEYYKMDNTDIQQLKTCLAAGFPFVFGFFVYSSVNQAEANNGRIPLPAPADQRWGGHAVLAVGYDDQTALFTIRNSWGQQKGDNGYYYMPYAYLTDPNLSTDFWTIRMVTNQRLKVLSKKAHQDQKR